jgi:hypothetical protein
MTWRGSRDRVTDARLEAAVGLEAEAVDRHGAAYLPIFERLKAELAARVQSRGAIARARSLARGLARVAA